MIWKAIKRIFETPEQTMAPFDKKFGEHEQRLQQAREHMIEAINATEKASELLKELVQKKH